MKNRFYTTNKDIKNAVKKLESLGFVRLPDSKIDDTRELTKVIIDSQSNTFWLLDQMCFEGNVHTIKNQFNENLYEFVADEFTSQVEKPVGFFEEVKRNELKELRDNFAGLAMQAELSTQTEDYTVTDFDTLSKHAYTIADAMLKARNNKNK